MSGGGLGAVIGAICLAAIAADAFAGDARVIRNVVYNGKQMKLDVYIPDGAKADDRFPAVIVIHGGGFVSQDKGGKREQTIAKTLAAAGYVAASINYTLAPKNDRYIVFPQNIHDCKTAVRFLRKNAAKYNIDPDKFGAIGGSAGGYFSMMLGYTGPKDGLEPAEPFGEVSSGIQAVVNMYGPVDFTVDPASIKGYKLAMHLPMIGSDERKKKLSPVTHANKGDPPTLILHGTGDKSIPLSQAETLAAALKKAKVPHHYIPVQKGRHSFRIDQPTDLRPTVIAFFDKYLKGKKDVTIAVPASGADGGGDVRRK